MNWVEAAQAAMNELATSGELVDGGKTLTGASPYGRVAAHQTDGGRVTLHIENSGTTFVVHDVAPAAEAAAKAAWMLQRVLYRVPHPQRWITAAVAVADRLGDMFYVSIRPNADPDGHIRVYVGSWVVSARPSASDSRKTDLTVSRMGRSAYFRECSPQEADKVVEAARAYLT